MTIRRLATSDNIIEALVPLMSTRPILSYDQAAAALREGGLTFGDGEDATDEALDDALDFGVGSEALFIVGDWIVHPAALASTKVFTHRITADDVSGEVIELFPDCAPWLPALTFGIADAGGANLMLEADDAEGIPDPDDAANLGSAETDDGADVRAVALAVAGTDPVPAELIGLGTHDDSGAMLILPEGTFAAAGVHEGDLIALRLIDGVIHLDALTEAPGTDAPGAATPPHGAAAKPTPADHDAVVAHLRAVREETTLIESVPEFLFRCILADRTLFDAPTAPITELLDAAGIHPEGDLIGDISEESAAKLREYLADQRAKKYDLKRHEARLLLDLLDAFDEYNLDGTAPDPDLAARGRGACADPWFAFALAEEAILTRESARALGAFAADPPAGAPRAVRSGLLYLRGRVHEAMYDPVTAIADYRVSAELHDSPFALRRLATIEFFRGNYDAARSLLDQSGANADHPLHEQIDRAARHTLPAEPTRKLGRNEPCWCGSGRKFKVCHARAGAAAPLAHRVPGLYDRAVGYVFDSATAEVLSLLNWAYSIARGPIPDHALLPIILDVLLIEDDLMAYFAEQYAAILPDDEVMVLEQWHLEANRSVFDIEAVVPGASMTLRDLRTGDRYEVVERSGSQQAQPGWYVCTRVADVAGEYQLFGGIEPVAVHAREALMELFDSSPTARDLVARLAARFAPPAVLSPEGDPMVMCEARYDVADPAGLRVILDELFESEAAPGEVGDVAAGEAAGGATDGDGAGGRPGGAADASTADVAAEWMWSEEIDADQHRVLASLTLTDEELVIRTSTEQRLERVLTLLEGAGADLVETEVERLDAAEMVRAFRAGELDADDEFADDEDLLDDDPFDGDSAAMFAGVDIDRPAPGLSMSPEAATEHPEVAAAVAKMIAGYEERWLDESIPALSGLTPREAAADPTRRDDLIRLLDSFPAKGSLHEMDGGRLRAALGL